MHDPVEQIALRRSEKCALYQHYVSPAAVYSARVLGIDRDFVRGWGTALTDAEGNRYLDFDAGSGVFNIGRNHPKVRAALVELLSREPANMVHRDTPLLAGLVAEALVRHTPPGVDRVLFTVTGSETTEAALKCARRLTGRSRFLYLEGDYHGGTYGALSVTDAGFARHEMGPLLPGCDRVSCEDLGDLRRELAKGDVAALIIEPLQGLTVRTLSPAFLDGAQRLCRERGALLIVDEVFTGFGRTGSFFACEQLGIAPDLLVLSKAMGGGFIPIGALVLRTELHARLFGAGGSFVHGSTFEHNDYGLITALATLQVIEDEGLVARSARLGDRLIAGLQTLAGRFDVIADVRGLGLLVGVELRAPRALRLRLSGSLLEKRGFLGHLLMMRLLEKHHIIATAVSRNNLLRFTPPLTVTEEEIETLLVALEQVLTDVYRFPDGFSRFFLGRLLGMVRHG